MKAFFQAIFLLTALSVSLHAFQSELEQVGYASALSEKYDGDYYKYSKLVRRDAGHPSERSLVKRSYHHTYAPGDRHTYGPGRHTYGPYDRHTYGPGRHTYGPHGHHTYGPGRHTYGPHGHHTYGPHHTKPEPRCEKISFLNTYCLSVCPPGHLQISNISGCPRGTICCT
eukprot:XP_014779245.1 PREDICTED: histidine-rich glycoprotein-like [Octopus bimaculoides]